MQLDRNEQSLLCYLECRAVDNGGRVDTKHMNGEDIEIANRWDAEGFLRFGRLRGRAITEGRTHGSSHYVVLSDAAWEQAAAIRKARADRSRCETVDEALECRAERAAERAAG